MNFKVLTAENWLQQDPVLRRFGVRSAGAWLELFMRPQLEADVPKDVAELVEGARGAMLYGWFFYPLYAIAEGQLAVAAEAALRLKYVAVTGTTLPYERLPRFSWLLAWAIKKKVIPSEAVAWWTVTERRRNAVSHTTIQRLGMPSQALGELTGTCLHFNELFRP